MIKLRITKTTHAFTINLQLLMLNFKTCRRDLKISYFAYLNILFSVCMKERRTWSTKIYKTPIFLSRRNSKSHFAFNCMTMKKVCLDLDGKINIFCP